MRELDHMEVSFVSGGQGVCTPSNSIGGVGDPESVGEFLVSFYEGLVFATSHVIERVANAL